MKMTTSARNPNSRMFLVNMGVVSSLRTTFKVVREPRKNRGLQPKEDDLHILKRSSRTKLKTN